MWASTSAASSTTTSPDTVCSVASRTTPWTTQSPETVSTSTSEPSGSETLTFTSRVPIEKRPRRNARRGEPPGPSAAGVVTRRVWWAASNSTTVSARRDSGAPGSTRRVTTTSVPVVVETTMSPLRVATRAAIGPVADRSTRRWRGPVSSLWVLSLI